MTLALQVLITSSIFSVIIITLLLVQKRGYLKYKIFTVLMLFSSMLFLIASSAFFHYEFSGYQGLIKRYGKTTNTNKKLDEYRFNDLEIDVIEEFSQAKNTLIGYCKFLEESAQTYNPDDFSYENLLKEKYISQLESKENSLEYWEDIEHTIKDAYGNVTFYSWNKFPIGIIPSDEYQEVEIEKGTEDKHIEFFSKLSYIERKIKTIDRSSESIKNLWSSNKVFIYTILTKAKYNKIAKTVNDLIAVHEIISQEPYYKEFYANHNLWTDEGYYNDEFLNFPSNEIVSSYDNNWLFSFWDRRFAETNDKVVLKILKEIQTHYKD